MPLYCGVNGVKHKIKGLYTGIGGVKKELTEMWAAENGVKKLVYQVVKGSPIGDLPVGSIVKINENGKPVNYLIVHQGLPSDIYDASCDGTWLLRQDIAEEDAWDAGNVNKLESSTIYSYLNNTWLSRYDDVIKSAIKDVKIPYRKNGGENGTNSTGYSGLSCKIFMLSGEEVGFDYRIHEQFPADGALLSYFVYGQSASANSKRIATLSGEDYYWWLRSPDVTSSTYVCGVARDGEWDGMNAEGRMGIRPTLILPQSTRVDDIGNVLA